MQGDGGHGADAWNRSRASGGSAGGGYGLGNERTSADERWRNSGGASAGMSGACACGPGSSIDGAYAMPTHPESSASAADAMLASVWGGAAPMSDRIERAADAYERELSSPGAISALSADQLDRLHERHLRRERPPGPSTRPIARWSDRMSATRRSARAAANCAVGAAASARSRGASPAVNRAGRRVRRNGEAAVTPSSSDFSWSVPGRIRDIGSRVPGCRAE